MNNKGKASTVVLVFVLILFSFAILGAAAFFWLSYEKEKTARTQISEQLVTLTAEKDKIQKLLDEASQEKSALENKIKTHEGELAQLNQKLFDEAQAKTTLMGERDKLIEKINNLASQNQVMQEELVKRQEAMNSLETKLQEISAERDSLKQLTESTAGSGRVELETIVVSPSSQAQDQAGAAGAAAKVEGETGDAQQQAGQFSSASVLLVNRAHNFVVVDAGQAHGIKSGDIFDVFHNDEFIGKVKVEKVQETLCAAAFLENFKADLVSEHDVVKPSRQ